MKIKNLSHPTITRRIEDLSQDIENALEMKISQCEFYSIAMDESTSIIDTAQLSVFIRGITNNFEVHNTHPPSQKHHSPISCQAPPSPSP